MKGIILILVCVAIAGAQTQPVECASQTNAPDAVSSKSAGGTADRQAVPGVAAQIQPRRAAPQRSTFTCRCGTVDAAALTAKANSQEVPVLTALPGSFRFNHVLLRESTQFSSTPSGTLSVAMGRPGNGTDVISPFTLRNPVLNSFWYDRPGPPQPRRGPFEGRPGPPQAAAGPPQARCGPFEGRPGPSQAAAGP